MRSGFDLMSFPCVYTFKVFGHHNDRFCDRVRDVIGATVGTVPLDSVKVRESEHGKYVCVSVLAEVRDREQLERIYADLNQHDEVLLCL
ncbi:MAG TPA: DUF493 domain-containing protein [Candidatus Binatia bacterium]|nr:DUF493 domain-containing protein [Candidatus Binatia bacterium]